MAKESVDLKFNPKATYLGAFTDDGKIMGVVAWMRVGKTLRYKTDCVLPQYRGMGVYTKLWAEREFLCENQATLTTAFCTPKSLGMYLAHGFKIVRDGGIKFVSRRNK
jgi:hypothetical protein